MRNTSNSYKYFDYDYINEIPVDDILSQMGVEVNSRGKCFCVNPNCPDNNSKKQGAIINKNNNTLHCFVCGETYGNIGIIQTIMGFPFDKAGYKAAAEYIAENLGYSEAEKVVYRDNGTDEEKDEIPTPLENAIKNIQKSFTPQYLKEIGLETNPFTTEYIRVTNPKNDTSTREAYAISLKNSADLIKDKIKETIYKYKNDYNANLKMFKLLKNSPDNYLYYQLVQCKDRETFLNMYEIITNPELSKEKEDILLGCKQDLALNIKLEKDIINSHIKVFNQTKELEDLVNKIEEYEPKTYKKLSKLIDEEEKENNEEILE